MFEHYPEYIIEPVTDRTLADVAEVTAWLNGTNVYEDLFGVTDDLQDKADADLFSLRNPYRYKGALNYTDLNRIEYNYMRLCESLLWWGYPIRTAESIADESMCSSAYPWNMHTLPHLDIINTIRTTANDIASNFLRGAFTHIIQFGMTLDYNDVNHLEEIQTLSRQLLQNIDESAVYTGTVESGVI